MKELSAALVPHMPTFWNVLARIFINKPFMMSTVTNQGADILNFATNLIEGDMQSLTVPMPDQDLKMAAVPDKSDANVIRAIQLPMQIHLTPEQDIYLLLQVSDDGGVGFALKLDANAPQTELYGVVAPAKIGISKHLIDLARQNKEAKATLLVIYGLSDILTHQGSAGLQKDVSTILGWLKDA